MKSKYGQLIGWVVCLMSVVLLGLFIITGDNYFAVIGLAWSGGILTGWGLASFR